MKIGRGLKRLLIAAWVIYAGCVALYIFTQPADEDVNSASARLRVCLDQARGPDARRACTAEWGRGLTEGEPDTPPAQTFTGQRMVIFLSASIVPPLLLYGIGTLLGKLKPSVATPL